MTEKKTYSDEKIGEAIQESQYHNCTVSYEEFAAMLRQLMKQRDEARKERDAASSSYATIGEVLGDLTDLEKEVRMCVPGWTYLVDCTRSEKYGDTGKTD